MLKEKFMAWEQPTLKEEAMMREWPMPKGKFMI